MTNNLLLLLTVVATSTVYADTFNFATPTGSSTGGGPVNATATVVTGAGTVTITLNDLLANPTDVAQLISDFDFVLNNGATTGTLASQTGQLINVAGNGTFSIPAGNPTGWQLNSSVGGGIQISALGGGAPADLIIGPPGPGNVYSNANGSIAGNGPHNPFINQTGTFLLDVAGVTGTTEVTSATFSFGTTAGVDIPGVPVSSVPEPTSVMLLASTLGALVVGLRKRLSSR
jgi:hypothetical protein